MSSIHYKFRSSTEYDTITFDTQTISLNDLREAIMLQKKILKSPDYTLEITNGQTKEVYKEDEAMIPKNSSVIVKRVPVQRLAAVTDKGSGLTKEEEELTEMAFMNLSTTANLVNAKASEADKIKAMMKQSSEGYDPSLYQKRPPPSYICSRCGQKGHFVRQCPTQGDSRYNNKTVRAPSGIPREFNIQRIKQQDEFIMNLRGMQREGSRFSPAVGSDVVDHTKVPAELQCPHCKKLFNDVVVTPCCGESYCDECIRNYLIEHDLTCLCGETTSPDNLIANKSLRTAVNNFRNQKKSDLKSVPPSPDTQQPTNSITNGSSLNSIENQPSPQPATSTEADVVSAQNPPDIHSETSQSSDTAQLSVPSPKVGDLAVMNSPKKQVIEDGKTGMVTQGMVVQPQILSGNQAIVAGQVQPHIVPGSQAFHTAAGTAVYTGVHNAMRANYLLPQQQILQSSALLGPTIQYGINMPGGATIVKRLVPVPVGPRLAVSQVAHSGIPHGSVVPVDLNKQLLEQHGRPARKDKEKGDVESPMPLTEDEFYLWQNQFKQRRHLAPPVRETSRERHRSRSKSPTAEKRRRHRDKSMSHSADESSQERKKKREKKRHRDSSQESRGESAKSKSRSDRKHSSKKSSRHLPKHIKRELEEFEFDNELEFDEELRKVRKQSKKNSRSDFEYDGDFDNELHKLRKESKRKNKRSKETENTPSSTKSASVERNSSVSPEPNEHKDASNEPALKTEDNASETSKEVGAVVVAPTQDTENNNTETTDMVKENEPKPKTDATATENKPKKRTKIVRKIVKRVVKVKKRKGEIMSKTVISSGPALSEQIVPMEQTPIEKITPAIDSGISADAKKSDNTETPSSESALPENSRWETGEKEGVEKSPKGNTHEEDNASPVKKAKTLPKKDVTPKKVAGTSGRSQALASPQKKASELRARKEAQKRAIIEKAKKLKMLSESLVGEDEEAKKKREKYLLLKQKKLKERTAKLKKGMKQDTEHKSKSLRNTAEHSDEGKDDPEERSRSISKEDKSGKKPDQHFYKPGDAKLKSISEMSKQRLKQVETRRAAKKEVGNGEGDDVLKSKVTSIKKMITEKRRVIKTSVSEEEKEFTTSQSSDDIRRSDHRVVRIENKKKALSSAVEKTGQDKSKHKQREDSSERRHREKGLERERKATTERERKATTERDRAERRLLREKEERKEAKRQHQLERERKERKRLSILEQEKQESLQREKLALREKDRLERKLVRERELREELMREKEEEKFRRKKQELAKRKRMNLNNDDSDETSSKKSRRHKEVIKIDVSDKSEDESSENEKEKKKKKRSKKKKEKKKKRKKSEESDDENDESADSDDSSSEDDDEEEERKRKKKKKKHKRKHKKHRKSKKHKKKTKKKKTKKEKSESESEEEQESESKKSDAEEEDEEVEESEQESEESDNAKESKSASSEDESVKSSSDQNEEEEEETESKTEITEKSATELETETEKNDDYSKAKSEKTKEKTDNEPPVGKVKKKSSTGDAEDLELDYDEDIGVLDNDALYGDLNFADDEQTNPENSDEERVDISPEDGEILDEDLFSMKPNTVEKNLFSTEPNDTDIENAVDDAINELSLDISNRKNAVRKVEKSSDMELILKNDNSKNR